MRARGHAFEIAVAVALVASTGGYLDSPRRHLVPVHAGDRCFRCDQVITDPVLAAEAVRPDGSIAYRFRTVGCLLQYLTQGGHLFDDVFVTDYRSGRFVPATRATYVRTDVGWRTGEGPGVAAVDYVAFRSAGAAARFAERAGTTPLSWAEVRDASSLLVAMQSHPVDSPAARVTSGE